MEEGGNTAADRPVSAVTGREDPERNAPAPASGGLEAPGEVRGIPAAEVTNLRISPALALAWPRCPGIHRPWELTLIPRNHSLGFGNRIQNKAASASL